LGNCKSICHKNEEYGGAEEDTLVLVTFGVFWDLMSCRLVYISKRQNKSSPNKTMYSDTSANEDNSFRNHIR